MSTLDFGYLENSLNNLLVQSDENIPRNTPENAPTDPFSGYTKYFNFKKLSDVIIKYGSKCEHTFHGHRILLATQSEYFDKLFTQASLDVKEIALEGDEPDVVEAMLQLAYGHQLHSPTDEESLENVIFAIHLFQISTKYGFWEFEKLAIIGFTVCLSKFCDETAKGRGPTFEELTTIVKGVYDTPNAGRLVEPLIQVITTNPNVCAFRTWDSLSLLVMCAAQQEPRLESSLREELRKVRPSELEALDGRVLTKNCPACDMPSIKTSGMGTGGVCLTCGALFSGWHRP